MPFLLAFALAVALAFALTPLVARVAAAVGLVDRPARMTPTRDGAVALKIHDRPVPLAGGVPVVLVALAVAAVLDRPSGFLIGAAGVALAVGVLDDARPLPAWFRAQALLLAGILLAAGGWAVDPLGPLAVVGAVALTFATANAVNLIDGQDGLAAGATGASALGLAAATALAAGWTEALVPLALAGALCGFLPWNLPPARVFLGNGGAYGVGVLLAASACTLIAATGWRGVIAAGACLSVPAVDLAATVARRLRSGAALTVGDRRHTYDVLAERWGSRPRATVALVLAAAAGSAVGVAIVSPLAGA